MPIIKKKLFVVENIDSLVSPKKAIDELIDAEGGFISGDRNVTSNSEIETGPVDPPANSGSDYVKGVSTTTDRAANYRQDLPWFASMSAGAARGLRERKVLKKTDVEDLIEVLVDRTEDNSEILGKDANAKLHKVIDIIKTANFKADEVASIKTALDAVKPNKNL